MEEQKECSSLNNRDDLEVDEHHLQDQSFDPNDREQIIISNNISQGKPMFIITQDIEQANKDKYLQQQSITLKILTYNRKQRSLEQLSKRFIFKFQGNSQNIFELDGIALELKVQRRRVYDIINIYESLSVIKKQSKNTYIWRGLKQAIKIITSFSTSSKDYSNNIKLKQNSLQYLAFRFREVIQYCQQPLSLQEVAQIIINGQDTCLSSIKKDSNPITSKKIRRLYDIVNVFRSLGLVKKVKIPNKKSAYFWQGYEQILNLMKIQKQNEEILEYINLKNYPLLQNNTTRKQSKQNLDESNILTLNSSLDLKYQYQFSKKTFQPSIIRSDSRSNTIIKNSQITSNDICVQY